MPANAAMPSLPRLQDTSPAGIIAWADSFARALEIQIVRMNAAGNRQAWAVTNVTPTRTLNPGTATLQQTAEALATLVSDLTGSGVIA